MNVYFTYLKTRFAMGLQYRVAALAGMVTQFFWGFMYLMIFKAFYDFSQTPQPMAFEELAQYLWLQQALLVFVMLWFRDNSLFELITSGNIAYEMTRPINLYHFWYAKLLAQRLSGALLRFFPILFVAFFLPEPFNLKLPELGLQWLLFIVSMILGLLVVVGVSMLIYLLTFITLSPMASLLMVGVTGEFFAGQIIPVPLMPSWLQTLAYWLPFRYASDVPFRIYSGHIAPSQAISEIALQMLWLVVLLVFGQWAMNRLLTRAAIQGG